MLFYLSMVETQEDKNKVEQLYVKYRDVMFFAAKKILSDEMLAEDAVHRAFINIIKNLKNISEVSCPQTASFCVIISKRVAIDMLRREHRQKYIDADEFFESIPDNFDLEEQVILKTEKEALIDKISKLSDIYREIIYLYYSNNYSLKQIAKVLDISTETAKKRLQRARQQLAKMLREDGDLI